MCAFFLLRPARVRSCTADDLIGIAFRRGSRALYWNLPNPITGPDRPIGDNDEEDLSDRRCARWRRVRRAGPDHTHCVELAAAHAHPFAVAGGVVRRSRRRDLQSRQVQHPAEGGGCAAGDLRRGARRPGRRVLRRARLYARTLPAHPARRAAVQRRLGRGHVGRVPAHPRQVLRQDRRAPRPEGDRGLHARPRTHLQHQAQGRLDRRPRGAEVSRRRRHGQRDGQADGRERHAQAGAGVVRTALVGRDGRRVLPVGVDRVVQAREADQAPDQLSRAGCTTPASRW